MAADGAPGSVGLRLLARSCGGAEAALSALFAARADGCGAGAEDAAELIGLLAEATGQRIRALADQAAEAEQNPPKQPLRDIAAQQQQPRQSAEVGAGDGSTNVFTPSGPVAAGAPWGQQSSSRPPSTGVKPGSAPAADQPRRSSRVSSRQGPHPAGCADWAAGMAGLLALAAARPPPSGGRPSGSGGHARGAPPAAGPGRAASPSAPPPGGIDNPGEDWVSALMSSSRFMSFVALPPPKEDAGRPPPAASRRAPAAPQQQGSGATRSAPAQHSPTRRSPSPSQRAAKRPRKAPQPAPEKGSPQPEEKPQPADQKRAARPQQSHQAAQGAGQPQRPPPLRRVPRQQAEPSSPCARLQASAQQRCTEGVRKRRRRLSDLRQQWERSVDEREERAKARSQATRDYCAAQFQRFVEERFSVPPASPAAAATPDRRSPSRAELDIAREVNRRWIYWPLLIPTWCPHRMEVVQELWRSAKLLEKRNPLKAEAAEAVLPRSPSAHNVFANSRSSSYRRSRLPRKGRRSSRDVEPADSAQHSASPRSSVSRRSASAVSGATRPSVGSALPAITKSFAPLTSALPRTYEIQEFGCPPVRNPSWVSAQPPPALQRLQGRGGAASQRPGPGRSTVPPLRPLRRAPAPYVIDPLSKEPHPLLV
eukprot:TRINITY_DN8406_c0_g1_i1.p1 TRINITY_DN8406_c0_g1~~TRINITY_DN8406_c0_g1_i1.p1  ORF type:complete len:652 (+),score=128.33 TRINITY_DN8406_c0_g1_i1:105-2060(+)